MTSPDHESQRSAFSASSAANPPESLHALYASAFASIARGEDIEARDLAALRTTVRAFVRLAKSRGEPPEGAIASLKAAMGGSAPYHRLTKPQRLLRDTLMGWCLDDYYGPDDTGPVP